MTEKPKISPEELDEMCLERTQQGLYYREIGEKHYMTGTWARYLISMELHRRGQSSARLSDISMYAKMYENGASLNELRRATRLRFDVLVQRLEAAGVTIRPKNRGTVPEGFAEAYNAGLSYKELAEKFNVSKGSIPTIANRVPGLKRRDPARLKVNRGGAGKEANGRPSPSEPESPGVSGSR